MASKQDNETLKLLLIAGGGALVFFTFKKGFTNFLEKLGLKNSATKKDVDVEIADTSSPWQPIYYKNQMKKGPVTFYNYAYNVYIAKQIYNSVGYIQDDWSQAFGAIKTMQTKVKISRLAEVFFELYKKDLLEWLRGETFPADRFSYDEVAQAIKYVDKLPIK